MYRHILLATDGSPCALRAASAAAALAEAAQSKVSVVYVQPDILATLGITDAASAQQYMEVQEQNYADEYNSVVQRTRPPFDERRLPLDCIQARGYAGDAILAVAAQCGADLIVVGHRGLNALQSIFLGSTSERIVHSAKCSVLVVR